MSRLRLKTLDPLLTEHGCTPEELVVCCTELRGTDPSHPGMGCGRSACPNPPANDCQKDTDFVMGPWEQGVSPQPLCFGSSACVTGCCFPNDPCENLESGYCASIGGTPERDSCSKPDLCMGACCWPYDSSDAQSGSRCTGTFQAACLDAGGTFFDTGSECNDSIECLTGCCHGPVGERLCTDMTVKQCADIPGSIRRIVLCAADPCVNFCCRPSGVCSEMTGADCAAVDGQVQGIDCGEGLCEIKGCCPPEGQSGVCHNEPVGFCRNVLGEIPQPRLCEDGPTQCDPKACCLGGFGNICSNLNKQDCLNRGGDSFDTLCTDDLCDITGCCFPDGSCEDLIRRQCTTAEGEFQPASCSATPCDGACCLPDGSCEDLTLKQCTLREGEHLDELCVDEPCGDMCCSCGFCCTLVLEECDAIRGLMHPQLKCGGFTSGTICEVPGFNQQPECATGLWLPTIGLTGSEVFPVSDSRISMQGVANRSDDLLQFIGGFSGFEPGTFPDKASSTTYAFVAGTWLAVTPSTCRVSQCWTVIDDEGSVKFLCGYSCGCAPPECAGV